MNARDLIIVSKKERGTYTARHTGTCVQYDVLMQVRTLASPHFPHLLLASVFSSLSLFSFVLRCRNTNLPVLPSPMTRISAALGGYHCGLHTKHDGCAHPPPHTSWHHAHCTLCRGVNLMRIRGHTQPARHQLKQRKPSDGQVAALLIDETESGIV